MAYDETATENVFKKSFKFYKQRKLNNFESVITFEENDKFILSGVIKKCNIEGKVDSIFGVIPPTEWRAFSIVKRPGLIVIRNPFTPAGQRYWITRCLRDFTRKPNERNVDIYDYLKQIDQLWEHFNRNEFKEIEKLRWATIGYHHNWDTKIYSEDRRSVFPNDLVLLAQYFAEALGYFTFEAQSAIVNFYHPGNSLSGHVDRSEVDLDAPLLSLSFGQSAIFLVGGTTLDEEGMPLLLQSGDVLLMSREARLCYHAVPRILACETTPWNNIDNLPTTNYDKNNVSGHFHPELINIVKDEEFWAPFNFFISKSRINMNVRQVLPIGQTSLN